MKITKFISIFSIFALTCGTISGCGISNTDGNLTNSNKNDKLIKVYQMKVEINDSLQKLAKKYEEETGIKVEVNSVGGGADYGAALKAEFQKGTEPDIFVIQGTGDYEIWKHKIDDLTSEPWINNAVKGTLDAVIVDKKVYGMPAATEGYGLIYNKEILDKAGIDPDSIDTFDKLKSAFEILDNKKAELGIDNVVSYTTKETWVSGIDTFNIPLALQEKPTEFIKNYMDGKVDIVNNNIFNDWVNLVELLCKYGGGQNLETIDYSTQVGNFALGKTAFIQQGNWIASDLNSLGADFDMGFVPLCINNDSKINGSIPVGVPMYWVVNKDSKVNTEAKAFLNWLSESKIAQEALVNEMNVIPAFTNFTVESNNVLNKAVNKFNKSGKTIPWPVTMLPQGFAVEKIGPAFSTFVSSDMGIKAKKDFLETIQDAPK
ncbi:ABC transporter substrate-binding protein [Clostridium butyricum]|uniref:ABC transporter substrate-binding protein n=1 Tax=Clostridium butyricum TaxID=1492 RepID=UPI003D3405E0